MHALALALLAAVAGASPVSKRASGIQGFDISHYQGTVDFSGAYSSGARFVIIKATEGTSYIDPGYASHESGAAAANLIHGAYHFAEPASSSGAAQATYFLAHGGKWSNDGKTLPGMLDIEYNPSGATCYGLSTSAMTAWVKDFVSTYQAAAGRPPMIYTTNDWWSQCTGNAKGFSSSPLVLADYNGSPGTIPGDWTAQTIWQNTDKYSYGGDSDLFNGSEAELASLASGGGSSPTTTPTPKPAKKVSDEPAPPAPIAHRADRAQEVRWA